MESGFLQISLVVLLATFLGFLLKILKQPLIIAFIFTGIFIHYGGFLPQESYSMLQTLSDLGIMFLLFLIGLEIDIRSLKLIGKSSAIIGALQILITSIFAFVISRYLNISTIASIYIAGALTFSSTIIVVKLLSEKKDAKSLYGKISIGILLIQDLIAVLALVFLSSFQNQGSIEVLKIVLTVFKGAFIFGLILFIGKKFMPRILDKIAKSQELLFFSTLAWVFVVSSIVSHPKIGFPIEIGGLLAGLVLSGCAEQFQILSRIKYLRDFFVLIFFVILGTSMTFSGVDKIVLPILIFSVFVLIVKPFIVMLLMYASGYRNKTAFHSGITIGQTSEFGLVLAAIGVKLGHIDSFTSSLITGVSIITIILSTYMITYSNGIYRFVFPIIHKLQRKKLSEKITHDGEIKKPIILLGAHRLGQSILFNLNKEDVLIIDFDPHIVHQLKKYNYNYLFGDISDDEIMEKAHMDRAKLIISTLTDSKDNQMLISEVKRIKKVNPDLKVIVRAEDDDEMNFLYEEGADYVIYPHLTSGQYLGKSIAVDPDMNVLENLKNWDRDLLRKLLHQK